MIMLIVSLPNFLTIFSAVFSPMGNKSLDKNSIISHIPDS